MSSGTTGFRTTPEKDEMSFALGQDYVICGQREDMAETWEKSECHGSQVSQAGPPGPHPARELTTNLASEASTWGEGTDRLDQMSWRFHSKASPPLGHENPSWEEGAGPTRGYLETSTRDS